MIPTTHNPQRQLKRLIANNYNLKLITDRWQYFPLAQLTGKYVIQ